MTATVTIDESNGAGETQTVNISNCNMGSNDSANLVVATYPITVGTNSYHKAVRIHWSSGTANKLDNARFWKSAGTYVTGETWNWKTQTAYVQPTATALSGASSLPVADPGSSNVVMSLTSVGYSDYIFFQMATTGSSPPGNVNQKTLVFQYDEQ